MNLLTAHRFFFNVISNKLFDNSVFKLLVFVLVLKLVDFNYFIFVDYYDSLIQLLGAKLVLLDLGDFTSWCKCWWEFIKLIFKIPVIMFKTAPKVDMKFNAVINVIWFLLQISFPFPDSLILTYPPYPLRPLRDIRLH